MIDNPNIYRLQSPFSASKPRSELYSPRQQIVFDSPLNPHRFAESHSIDRSEVSNRLPICVFPLSVALLSCVVLVLRVPSSLAVRRTAAAAADSGGRTRQTHQSLSGGALLGGRPTARSPFGQCWLGWAHAWAESSVPLAEVAEQSRQSRCWDRRSHARSRRGEPTHAGHRGPAASAAAKAGSLLSSPPASPG